MITLGEYMMWICDLGGDYKSGNDKRYPIGIVPKVILKAPNGRTWSVIDMHEHEHLPLKAIRNLNRRLGVEPEFEWSPLKAKISDYN